MDMKTQQYIRDLDNLKTKTEEEDDEEVKSYLVKLLCVRTAGLLEVFLKTRISEYSKNRVPKEISRFLNTKFKDITNLKSSKFEEVLTSFSVEWGVKFRDYLDNHEQEKTSLDSVIAQRHIIAHGQSSNIGSTSMVQYYNDVKSIVVYLDTIIR
jgi:hypothetical protein